MKTTLSIILLFCFNIKAHTMESINCDSAMTQFEMNGCAKLAFSEADNKLNAIYNNILSYYQNNE
jgi:uncharacterized protein YecT (DUF1311 family)